MESLLAFVSEYARYAHWYIFCALILAGCNVPISADVLIALAAFLAAAVIPEHLVLLFASVLLGCYFSAGCAFWLGRLAGKQLLRLPFFAKLLPEKRLERMRSFYERRGFATLLVGRFIPFGMRNAIFMAAGMSRFSFSRFLLMDVVACSLWVSTLFVLFYTLGQNYQEIWEGLKTWNLIIFSAFSVTGIGWIWYKRQSKNKMDNLTSAKSPEIEDRK